jgi:hydroxyacylglutathione hydrolase
MVKHFKLKSYYPMNAYIIREKEDVFIIDLGTYSDEIDTYIKSNNYKLKGIILTHAHLDHIDGIGVYDVPIYIHKEEIDVLKNNHLNGYALHNSKPSFRVDDLEINEIDETSSLHFGNTIISFIHTPGHTKGSMSVSYRDCVFTGDCLFKETVGITHYPTGNQKEMNNSLRKIISSFDDQVNVYPGHGDKTTIKHERKHNPFVLKALKAR